MPCGGACARICRRPAAAAIGPLQPAVYSQVTMITLWPLPATTTTTLSPRLFMFNGRHFDQRSTITQGGGPPTPHITAFFFAHTERVREQDRGRAPRRRERRGQRGGHRGGAGKTPNGAQPGTRSWSPQALVGRGAVVARTVRAGLALQTNAARAARASFKLETRARRFAARLQSPAHDQRTLDIHI